MITPEPPAGSEHYREGWRHGYEQAAIDRERSADAVRVVPDDVSHQARILAHEACEHERKAWRRGYDEARAEFEQPVGAVPDTGQAREPDTEWPARRELEGVQRTIAAIGGDAPARAVADYVAMRLRALDDEPGADAARWTPPVQPGDTVQASDVAALLRRLDELAERWELPLTKRTEAVALAYCTAARDLRRALTEEAGRG